MDGVSVLSGHPYRSFTSPQHMSRCSLQPRSPKWTVLLNQSVLSKASGVDFRNNSLSYSSLTSFSVTGTEGSGFLPLPFFLRSQFCLTLRLFRLFQTRRFL